MSASVAKSNPEQLCPQDTMPTAAIRALWHCSPGRQQATAEGASKAESGSKLSTPFHKYGDIFGVRKLAKLACVSVRRSLLRPGNAREASFAL